MTSTSKNGPGSVCVSKIYEWYTSCLTFTNGKNYAISVHCRQITPSICSNMFKSITILSLTKKLQTHFLARGKRQTKSISRRILPKKCSKWLKNSKAGRVQFPTNSVATFEVLTPIVKVWCLFKVVSGGPGANLETLTAQMFRCQVLMCISTAQTRSKWLALLLPLHFARFLS